MARNKRAKKANEDIDEESPHFEHYTNFRNLLLWNNHKKKRCKVQFRRYVRQMKR
jgi:hypothetical protein